MSLKLDCIGKEFGPYPFQYTHKEVILYALSVGAAEDDLHLLYEGHPSFSALPTFAVIPATKALFDAVGEVEADLTRLLHGEQEIRVYKTIPTQGTLYTKWSIPAIYDKGKGALILVRTLSFDQRESLVSENLISLYIKGEGGFGGDPGPKSEKIDFPEDAPPDIVGTYQTQRTQALLYRLNGDENPLHASPEFAQAAGFERPILHGLCTLGIAVRLFIKHALDNIPSRVKEIKARFSGVVFPGDMIKTEAVKLDNRWVLRVTTDRGSTAISNFLIEVG